MREGSNPNFCPPMEEGMTLAFTDDKGNQTEWEFLGLIIHGDRSYGFFFPLSEDSPVGSSGEVVCLEAIEFEDDQPTGFEPIMDEAILAEVYESFKEATKDIYSFA